LLGTIFLGSAGEILVGINLDLFDVVAWDIRNYSVSVVARNKIADVVVRITTVYGSPYEEKKDEFIPELHELFLHWEGGAIIGGDFNLVRSQLDKSNGNIDHRWTDKFNAWVDIWPWYRLGSLEEPSLGPITKKI
jgi:hypothetical protein